MKIKGKNLDSGTRLRYVSQTFVFVFLFILSNCIPLTVPVCSADEQKSESSDKSLLKRNITKKQKEGAKIIQGDPECRPFSPVSMDWKGFSEAQKHEFEDAFKLAAEFHYDLAIKKYEILSVQIKKSEIFYNLALAQCADGDLLLAESSLKQAAKLNPLIRETFKVLSKIEKALGNTAEAQYNMNRYNEL